MMFVKEMKRYPITKGVCTECEFEMVIIFIEHADEVPTPLYCPVCSSEMFEGVELKW